MITNISSGSKKKYVDEQDDALAAQISGKAPTKHASSGTTYGVSTPSAYGHAMASSTTPKANGTADVGTETAKFARGDHVHPLQTTVIGNAGSSTKLATARTITINGESSGVSFNGTADVTVPLARDTAPTQNSGNVITSGAVYTAIQAVKSDVASVYKVKGSITWSNLIVKTDAEVGDVYNVTDGTYAGANFVCTKAKTAGESSWDKLSETLDLSPYAKTADVNTALAGKQAKVTGAATTVVSSNLTASRVIVSDSNGKIAASGITSAKLGYLSDVTSAIQAQLDAKQAKLTIDSALSSTSTNPIQNKAVVIGLTNKVTANSAITAATRCKITYDAKGLVTAGANLAASDIPALDASKITTGTLGTDRIPTLPISKISGLQSSLMSSTDKAKLDEYGINEATTCAMRMSPSDLMNIDTTTPKNTVNMSESIVAVEDASTLSNSPIISGAFYAVRKVYWMSADGAEGNTHGKVIVELHEAYPVVGRVWTNVYNKDTNTWSNWGCRCGNTIWWGEGYILDGGTVPWDVFGGRNYADAMTPSWVLDIRDTRNNWSQSAILRFNNICGAGVNYSQIILNSPNDTGLPYRIRIDCVGTENGIYMNAYSQSVSSDGNTNWQNEGGHFKLYRVMAL